MITVSGLTKQYGARTVVDDVSFTLEPGTVTGFLGPNGAGKTTTMRMITGLVPATAGTALVDGSPYPALANPGALIGTLLDASAVHPGRTGRVHLRLLADTIGVPSSRVGEVLEMVGLTDAARRRIGGYSLGMRQRLGIAGALLADPPVLVFDEPANGLGPEGHPLVAGSASRPTAWTRRASAGCVICCAGTRRGAARCCCRRTCWARSSTPWTGCW